MTRTYQKWLLSFLFAVLAVIVIGNTVHWTPALLSPKVETFLALRILKTCNGSDEPCNAKALRSITAKRDPATALNVLALMTTQDERIRNIGHTYAHEIGYATYERYPTLSTRLSACRDTMGSGCYHGVMMMDIGSNGMPSHEKVRHVCDALKTNSDGLYLHCLHGTGHGVMMAQLMMASRQPGINEIRQALASCDATEGEFERYHCARGAFMEYFVASSNPIFHYAYMPTYQSRDPQWPCDAVDSKFVRACYDYQANVLLNQAGGKYRSAFKLCAQALPVGRKNCAANLGRILYSLAAPDNARSIIESCNEGLNDTQRGECLGGAAQYYMDDEHNIDQAFALCVAGPVAQQRTCGQIVQDEAPMYGLSPAITQAALNRSGLMNTIQ